ncbi:unnamed protein product [Rotaria magnacalcarata]|uniref:DUF6973 domain-containing protein n=1 Tax=Rotaria magnacalcarata TaxID=392030 RepID=A0A815QY65_9BILA|nr:unnamed protein product [Rotaria magnacalcarata]CAF1468057.1 unnamed protein product [Rotaria magnacalcarata]CAF1929621.1 unnamed protein product [Rotaria magnacalcarata]CAF2079583.1 unnamed protein product [Rotaria magnacalcarata]CAF2150528.1 unnamed protein product [Rotaria magnacalcarata]
MQFIVVVVLATIACIQAAPTSQVVDKAWGEPRGSTLVEGVKCLFLVGPFDCAKAKTNADVAAAEAQNSYPAQTLHNGIGDAFRHCYWNALMTISIGRDQAKKVADLHEDNNTTGPLEERAMDLKNNEIGRQVGSESKTTDEARAKCADHVETGYLQLKP